MAGSLNRVTLIGNLCKDPDVRTKADGRTVANIVLATNESWKDKDGNKKEKVEYHRIACFNEGLVGIIQKYLRKGSKVYIEGFLQTGKYTDKDGIERYQTNIVLQGYNCSLVLLDKPDSQDTGHKPEDDNQDIPF